MDKDSLNQIIDTTKVQNSTFSKVTDTIVTMKDLKEEIIFNSDKVIDANNGLGLPEWISIIVTGIFGILAVWFYVQQKKQGKNIDAQVNRLADINRPFHKTFPEIMSTLLSLFEIAKSNPNKSELYIMNRTSAFGKIHSFNPKFYSQYDLKYENIRPLQKEILIKYHTNENEKGILNDFNKIEDKCKYLFSEDVRKLYGLIKECSSVISNENFKLIVFCQEESNDLKENFIQKYIDEVHTDEDIKAGIGLEYFTYIPKSVTSASSATNAEIKTYKIKTDLSNKEEVTNKIIEDVISTHNNLVGNIREGKRECEDESCWLKYSTEIPMQMYLLKTTKNGIEEYHTFIINAMSTKSSGNPDRYVDGIYSREQSLFSVFKTLFKETFKNNESFKD